MHCTKLSAAAWHSFPKPRRGRHLLDLPAQSSSATTAKNSNLRSSINTATLLLNAVQAECRANDTAFYRLNETR